MRVGENNDGMNRVYVVKARSKTSFTILSSMTLVQFAYSVVHVALFRREGEVAFNPIRIAEAHKNQHSHVTRTSPKTYTFAMCLQSLHGTGLQLEYLGPSLGFGSPPSFASNGGGAAGPEAVAVGADIVAFLMIAVYSYRSAKMVKASWLLGRVAQDVTIYFLAIVWAHLTVTIYTSRM